MRERFRVIGKTLREVGSSVEAVDEGLVIFWPYIRIQKFNRRFLLELETVANGVARIDEQTDLERQVGFTSKAANLDGWFAVVNHPKIVLLQVLDVATVLVRDREDHPHFVYGHLDGGDR